MSDHFTEANYENAVLLLFQQRLSYAYIYGPDVERDYHCPLCLDALLPALRRVNPALPEAAIAEAVYKLQNFEGGTLLQKNMVFMDYLQNGVPVKYVDGGEERSALVYLLDYQKPENNDFTVSNQWTVIENSEKRPDVILFVNGLPLVVMELKSPSREETDASAAYRQLRNYNVRNSVPVRLQRGMRHERHDHLEGGHHHLRRGPLHGVEDQGRQLRAHPVCHV